MFHEVALYLCKAQNKRKFSLPKLIYFNKLQLYCLYDVKKTEKNQNYSTKNYITFHAFVLKYFFNFNSLF